MTPICYPDRMIPFNYFSTTTGTSCSCCWMVDIGQSAESPVRGVRKLNEKVDVRRDRRAATPDGLRRLNATAAAREEVFGTDGPERSLLYRFCAETGLRANECRRLSVGDIDFDRLTVRIRAAYSKHRDIDTIPFAKTSPTS